MVKYHSYATNPAEWLTHIASDREKKDVEQLEAAIQQYPDLTSLSLKKGVGIADILWSLSLENEILVAALIYPGVQAEEIQIDAIEHHLGISIRKLVSDLLQMQFLGRLKQLGQQRNLHQIENLRKMLLAMVTDIRAVVIIIAERLWELREAKHIEKKEQQKLAQETLDVYAPLANRLGVWPLKWEIEDLCLRYLQPDVYSNIAKWLASKREEREKYIEHMITLITDLLKKTDIQDFKVSGRVKHIYSIYRKMQRKNVNKEEIYDISAVRILVADIPTCYHVLSILQSTWQHVPHEFDDYISQPKANGYRSIHMVIIDQDHRFIEIQIRTYQMHEESELGMASHWQYKESIKQHPIYESKIALLRQIMAWQKEVFHEGSSKSEQTIEDLFADRIYVFTPIGDIIDLMPGATPLDFAYHIHSEVGHRCRGAKIDGSIVTLTHPLKTGDRVEILTAKEAHPSRDWLNPHLGYLKTVRARAKVQHWFRVRDSKQNIAIGRELLEKELKKIGQSDKIELYPIAKKLNFKTGDDLLAAIGLGDIGVTQIIHQLRPMANHTPPQPIRHEKEKSTLRAKIQTLGIKHLLTQIAGCCKPLPGDVIIGYVTRNRGVSIHRRDCTNITQIGHTNKNRLIEVNWGEKNQAVYPVDLQLKVDDRAGLLRDITSLLASEKINVLGLQAHKNPQMIEADIYLTIQINNMEQMNKAIELLKHIPNVLDVYRR